MAAHGPPPLIHPHRTQSLEFSDKELNLYSRQMKLPQVGREGQKKLKAAKVLMVGTGGLGSPVALYLTAAGVGHLGLVDHDLVDQSNLHRQILFTHQDLHRPKVQAAKERLQELNPFINLSVHHERFSAENALSLVENYDLIIDGSDNFATRYLVNDACISKQRPYVFASVDRFHGQISLFGAPQGPCYRCLYPRPPTADSIPNCAQSGVLGVIPGLIGTLQANEALKYILGFSQDELLIGKVLCVDALSYNFRLLTLPKDQDCPLCSDSPKKTIHDLQDAVDYQKRNLSSMNCPSTPPDPLIEEITPLELKEKQELQEDFFLLDVRTLEEYEYAHLGGYLLPIHELPQRIGELRPYLEKEVIVYCHHGVRSFHACQFLIKNGFSRVKNLSGGIDEWSLEVDGSVARY